MFACRHLTKEFGKILALKDASLRLAPKELLCITGPSGCGKTVLWSVLTGQDRPTNGVLEVDGVDIATLPPDILRLYKSRVGIIAQNDLLDPRLTVAENIALPLNVLGAATSVIDRNVGDLLKRFGLSTKADLFPPSLTPSDRRLVAIARALVAAPVILFADEPFQHLDQHQRETVAMLLSNMRKKGTSCIVFLRDASQANLLSPTQVLKMNEGTLEAHVPSRSQSGTSAPTTQEAAPILEHTVPDFALPTDDAVKAPRTRGPLHGRKIPITAVGSL